MLLRARVVLPVTRPPIDDGAVLISGNRIRTVCCWRELSVRAGEQVVELGDTVLLPGFVNAHCHLDYTDLAGEIPATKLFTDWIKSITTAKAGQIYADPIQFPDKIGRTAVQTIRRYLDGDDVPSETLIPTALYRKADAEKDPALKQ